MKREYRGVLIALKKVRVWLYSVHFILEIDISVLIIQLNRSGADLSGVLMIRWLAWIRLFDFEVRYIPNTKYIAADDFSYHPRTKSDDINEKYAEDINDFIII